MRNWNQKSLWILGCLGLMTMVGCHKAPEDSSTKTNTYRSKGKGTYKKDDEKKAKCYEG